MLRFIFTKIKNKYRLYMALMVGVISVVAVFSIIMMLRRGSIDKLIQSGFLKSYEENEKYPATMKHNLEIEAEPGELTVDMMMNAANEEVAIWDKYLELPVVGSEYYIKVKGRTTQIEYRTRDGYFDLDYINEDYDGEHFKVLDGTTISKAENVPEGYYPCLISTASMDVYNLVVGEKLSIIGLGDSDNPPVNLIIVGIIEEAGYDDYHWISGLKDMGTSVLLAREDLEEIISSHKLSKGEVIFFRQYDYRKINSDNSKDVYGYIKSFKKNKPDISENFSGLLFMSEQDAKSVNSILYAISIPMIVLVFIFIGMVSVRITSSEQGEIAVLHSRGVKRKRIVFIYMIQSLILSGIAVIPGLVLGFLVGKLIATSTGFLTFSLEPVKGYNMNPEMILAAFIAAGVSAVVMLIPVIPVSKTTVIENKNKKTASGVPGWEKYFIDLALLGISIYLLYDYTKQQDSLKLNILAGKGIDPMIFINSTLFLVSCGLLILRLLSYVVKLIFKMRKNKFSPAYYASFVQIIRTRKSTGTISVFLVLTIAMSIFDANMARTINSNQEARIEYNMGADVVIRERWDLMKLDKDGYIWKYKEPDYNTYETLVSDGTAECVAKALRDDKIIVKIGKSAQEIGSLVGVETVAFGNTAYLRSGLNEVHWYNYLNELSQNTKGVLISRNLAEKYDLKAGDTLTYSRYSPTRPDDLYGSATVTVVDVIDAFPGYKNTVYEYNEAGVLVERDNYLLVANYPSVVGSFEKTPYEVWVKTDKSAEEIKSIVNEKIKNSTRYIKTVVSTDSQIEEMKASAVIKITNGLFTLNFLVALLLCVIGYLIHWITSIRDRELLFGIYRAMGLSMKEINKMLAAEQMFMSLGPVLAGVGAGSLATLLFSKLFAVVYLPEKHVVKLITQVSAFDMLRLCIVMGVVIILCFTIIRRIVKKMNIAEALKLGED